MKKLTLLLAVLLFCVSICPAAADSLFSGMRTYDEGQYKVGRDMVADEYVLLATTDYSGYFCISSDALGNDIISNGLFDVNSILTVEYGEYVELSRCIAVRASDFYSQYTIKTSNYGVMLKVGYDVMPGEYKLKAQTGEQGYYCIYDDSRQIDIVDNDLFTNSTYVTLKFGQYIVLSRCMLLE